MHSKINIQVEGRYLTTQQTQDVESMFVQRWTNVEDSGPTHKPTLIQRCVSAV